MWNLIADSLHEIVTFTVLAIIAAGAILILAGATAQSMEFNDNMERLQNEVSQAAR